MAPGIILLNQPNLFQGNPSDLNRRMPKKMNVIYRYIQHRLELASMEEKQVAFNLILPQAVHLMNDVFGNYVIQVGPRHSFRPFFVFDNSESHC